MTLGHWRQRTQEGDWVFTYPPDDRNPLEGLLQYNVYVPVRVHEVRKAPCIPEQKLSFEKMQSRAKAENESADSPPIRIYLVFSPPFVCQRGLNEVAKVDFT